MSLKLRHISTPPPIGTGALFAVHLCGLATALILATKQVVRICTLKSKRPSKSDMISGEVSRLRAKGTETPLNIEQGQERIWEERQFETGGDKQRSAIPVIPA